MSSQLVAREISQFTSSASAAVASISMGFIPTSVLAQLDVAGTNPKQLTWYNRAHITQWPVAANNILNTGSSGVLTVVTNGISAYAGGDVVTSADVAARKYFKSDGTLYAAGDTTGPGITIAAANQVNSGINIIEAYRN